MKVNIKLVVRAELRGPKNEMESVMEELVNRGYYITSSSSTAGQYCIIAERQATDDDLTVKLKEKL